MKLSSEKAQQLGHNQEKELYQNLNIVGHFSRR
jgi:hypothetical protein